MSAILRDWYRSTFGQALIGAVLLWAALPPLGIWPLAWIAPVWWVLLIRREKLPLLPAAIGPAAWPWILLTVAVLYFLAGLAVNAWFHSMQYRVVLAGRHGFLARPGGDFSGRRATLGGARLSIACGWRACSSGWPPCNGCGCRTGPSASAGWPWASISAVICRLFVGLSRVGVHVLRLPVILVAPVVYTGLELAQAHLLSAA